MENKKILRALKNEIINPPPFWFLRQAGRYLPEYQKIRKTEKNFFDLCYKTNLAVEITLQPVRRWKTDAAILFSDILVIPDALGQEVTFREGIGPILKPLSKIRKLKDIDDERIRAKLNPVFQTVKALKSKLDFGTTLIGFAGAPWTVAVYMIEGRSSKDWVKARTMAYRDTKAFTELIDILVHATSLYLIEQIKAGAEVIQIFDSWAGVLSDSEYDLWVIKPTKQIISKIKKVAPKIPIIGFPRKSGNLYLDFVRETGVDGISLDETVSLSWAAKNLQPLTTIQGNLDNHLLLVGGEKLAERVRKIIRNFENGPFIFNLGHGILPGTPLNNIQLVLDTIKSVGK